jgi:hypothetical protein
MLLCFQLCMHSQGGLAARRRRLVAVRPTLAPDGAGSPDSNCVVLGALWAGACRGGLRARSEAVPFLPAAAGEPGSLSLPDPYPPSSSMKR